MEPIPARLKVTMNPVSFWRFWYEKVTPQH
jgi:hypothetical protein